MRLPVICLLLIALFAPLTAAVADSTATAVDTSVTAAETSSTTATATVSPADTGQAPVYPMDAARKAKLIAYSDFNNVWRFASFFIGIAILLIILLTGLGARLRDWAQVARKRFFVVWLFFVMFLAVNYILNLPFDVYRGFIVEKQYGFMQQSFWGWWGDNLLSLLLGAVLGIIPMWFFYWLIGKFRRWWLVFTVGAIPFAILMIVVAPVFISPMFNKFVPLKNQELRAKLVNLADKAGIGKAKILEVDASKQSTKINAYVTGLFGTKRIVLYDTLLKNFTDNEILFVMGHEMGHYIHHDVWKGLGVGIIFFLLALWLTDKTIRPVIRRYHHRFKFDRLTDIASLPLVMIFLSVISFLFQPVMNTASRAMEHAADKFGMQVSGVSGETAAIAFDKMAAYNLSDPDPNPIIEFWFYDHPALKKRMAFVRSYAAHRKAATAAPVANPPSGG